MTVYYTFMESPIQQLMLTSDGEALTGLRMIEHRHAPAMTEAWKLDNAARPFAEAKRQLAAYFNGELSEFELPLNLQGTDFQRLIWRELRKIPFGETMSYGEMAQRIGNPNGSRAVGAANGRNPVSIIIPCHRLIGSDGKLTDYGGGLERKEWLLAHERNEFSQHVIVSQQHIGSLKESDGVVMPRITIIEEGIKP